MATLTAAAAVILASGAAASLAALLAALTALAIMCAATWAFLAYHATRRRIALCVLLATPLALIAFYIAIGMLLEVILCIALAAITATTARAALPDTDQETTQPTEQPADTASRPYLIMNPRSGGGKVEKYRLQEKATALGAEVQLLTEPGRHNPADLAAHAIDNGADLLGVAGGDGTQALVADVAATHDIPLLVICAGTRNHFAMDLGLDRNDPSHCLDALHDGVELRIDLGMIGDRAFVNNASFGAYAEIVQSPAYRNDKVGTALQKLPDLVGRHHGPRLDIRIDGHTVLTAPQAVLISNNPYDAGDIAGLGRRARLDRGVLGVLGIKVESGAQAAALLSRRGQEHALARFTGREVIVDADEPSIPVGIDGEAVLMPTPVRCTIRPRALRVLVPRTRPGVPAPHTTTDWTELGRTALGLPPLARPA